MKRSNKTLYDRCARCGKKLMGAYPVSVLCETCFMTQPLIEPPHDPVPDKTGYDQRTLDETY